MVFEYNSAVFGDASNASMLDHANNLLNKLSGERSDANTERHRPLIFVAHSLGGE